jgi:hypothetical protein
MLLRAERSSRYGRVRVHHSGLAALFLTAAMCAALICDRPKPAEPEPKRPHFSLGRAGKSGLSAEWLSATRQPDSPRPRYRVGRLIRAPPRFQPLHDFLMPDVLPRCDFSPLGNVRRQLARLVSWGVENRIRFDVGVGRPHLPIVPHSTKSADPEPEQPNRALEALGSTRTAAPRFLHAPNRSTLHPSQRGGHQS